MTPLQAALSKRLVKDRHNSCAVSTFPSAMAVSVCFITVRSVALRCRLRIRFVLSARACFFADCRCKTSTPFENFSPDYLEANRGIIVKPENICTPAGRCGLQPHRVLWPSHYGIYYNCLLQCVYLIIPQNIGFVHIFSEIRFDFSP